MTDIIERLRRAAYTMFLDGFHSKELANDAADEIERLKIENERLRHVVCNCAAALVTGAFVSPKASIEFMEGVPKEISLVVSGLRAATPAPQTQERG